MSQGICCQCDKETNIYDGFMERYICSKCWQSEDDDIERVERATAKRLGYSYGWSEDQKKENKMSLTFSKSTVFEFNSVFKNSDMYRGLRMGQAFHQYMKLDKITNPEDKILCDKLYEKDGQDAINMIESMTDYSQ